MPTINLNKKEFDKLLGKKLPDEELKDRISMLGTDLEDLNNELISVEIFPNRPDMLSMQGFVRALQTFIGIKKGLANYKIKKSNEKVIVDASVKNVRPYTACAIVKNLKFTDERIKEIIDIQEKLHGTYGRNRRKAAIGIYPFEKITLPITFFAEDPKKVKFQPLEFPREITAQQILSQHPTGREYGHLLEGHKKYPFFKDAKGKILSMPPIINSHDVGKITDSTKDVFVECSGFDLRILKKCLNMIVTALADMGGEIYSMDVMYGKTKETTPNLTPEEMKLDLDYCNKRLGLELKEADVKKLLEKMGYDYKNKKVIIPAYRADIMHQVDIFEDIAIAYGFENFVEEIPKVATIGEESKITILQRKIAQILTGLNLLELNTYNISNNTKQNTLMKQTLDLVELESSVSKDYTHLRGSMLPSLLEVFSSNRHNEFPQKIFDMGTVFIKDNSQETKVREDIKLGLALSDSNVDFTQIKQILDYLLRMLDLNYEIEELDHPSFIEGRVGKIIINNQEVGIIGELSPDVLRNWDLEFPVSTFELNISRIKDEIL